MENNDNANDFECSIRILGNELIAFKLRSTNKTNKWMFASIVTLGLLIWAVSLFGPTLVEFMKGVS